MLLSDYIRVYEDSMSIELADALVRTFEGSSNVQEGMLDPRIRRSVLDISKHDSLKCYQDNMIELAQSAIAQYKKDVPVVLPERLGLGEFTLWKYIAERDDEISVHVDVGHYAAANRFLTLLWFLNNVQEGGE